MCEEEEEVDLLYFLMKQVRLLRFRYIGRWDWHLWNFLLALLPGCGVYGLAMVGRHQYDQGEKLVLLKKEKEELEAKEREGESPIVRKLEDLEQQIKEVQLSLWVTRRLSNGQHPLLKDPVLPEVEDRKANGTQIPPTDRPDANASPGPLAMPQSSRDVSAVDQGEGAAPSNSGLLRMVTEYLGLSSRNAGNEQSSSIAEDNSAQESPRD